MPTTLISARLGLNGLSGIRAGSSSLNCSPICRVRGWRQSSTLPSWRAGSCTSSAASRNRGSARTSLRLTGRRHFDALSDMLRRRRASRFSSAALCAICRSICSSSSRTIDALLAPASTGERLGRGHSAVTGASSASASALSVRDRGCAASSRPMSGCAGLSRARAPSTLCVAAASCCAARRAGLAGRHGRRARCLPPLPRRLAGQIRQAVAR